MVSLVRIADEDKIEKEPMDSGANRTLYTNNVESLTYRRNQKLLSKVRSKVLKAAEKINW
ncbi:hypothetical protein [Yokenella regensburgei]|uniref:hypothetical protein n=1 Tax=Yokenella regensburgei TaxID=158877 RepID=UPI0031E3CFF6